MCVCVCIGGAYPKQQPPGQSAPPTKTEQVHVLTLPHAGTSSFIIVTKTLQPVHNHTHT